MGATTAVHKVSVGTSAAVAAEAPSLAFAAGPQKSQQQRVLVRGPFPAPEFPLASAHAGGPTRTHRFSPSFPTTRFIASPASHGSAAPTLSTGPPRPTHAGMDLPTSRLASPQAPPAPIPSDIRRSLHFCSFPGSGSTLTSRGKRWSSKRGLSTREHSRRGATGRSVG